MKSRISIALLVCLLLAACAPKATVTPTAPLVDMTVIDWLDPSPFQRGLADPTVAPPNFSRAPYYRMDLTIADDLLSLTGSLTLRFTNQESVALNEVVLRLMANLLGGSITVTETRVDGIAVTPALSANDSVLTLPLPGPIEPGGSLLVSMKFATTIPDTLESNYGVLAYYNDVLALAHYYPQIAVYDEEGWSTEIPSEQGDVVYADAAYYLVDLKAPENVVVVATGIVLGNGPGGGTLYAIGPARDFYLALSPDYERYSQQVGNVTVNSYAQPALKAGAEQILEIAVRALGVFNELYGPYPYTELDLVATPTYALGIEYPGMIAITDRLYDPDSQFSGGFTTADYLEGTIAHEVGHQWIFNLVGNDQLNDPWLDESLTQFLTLQYYEQVYGAGSPQAQSFHGSLVARWQRVENSPIPVGLPVSAYQGREYGAIVYGRGGLFFEALREQMGADPYQAFLEEYVGANTWGIATPEGLQSLAESRCACDLDALFAEWIYP